MALQSGQVQGARISESYRYLHCVTAAITPRAEKRNADGLFPKPSASFKLTEDYGSLDHFLLMQRRKEPM